MRKHLAVNILLGVTILLLGAFGPAYALPEVDNVASGDVQIQYPDQNTLQINASDKAIINYKSFDIRQNESVVVNLPSSQNMLLNRVIGDKVSEIFCSLTCNGIFMLVNPNGINIGPTANIDVAGLVASTRDITNSDFLSSHYVFEKMSKDQLDLLLLNQGNITIRDGGFGVLIAGAIENTGVIAARLGTISLAAGDMVTLGLSENGLISIAIDLPTAKEVYDYEGKPVSDQIRNIGILEARSGSILMKAESINNVFKKAINLEGYVNAAKLDKHADGTIHLASKGEIVVNADINATNIIIGEENIAPKVVTVEGKALNAEKSVKIAAENISVITSSPLTEVYKVGYDLSIASASSLDNLITLEGLGFKLTYLANSDLTLHSDNAVNTAPGVILSGNQVKVIGK